MGKANKVKVKKRNNKNKRHYDRRKRYNKPDNRKYKKMVIELEDNLYAIDAEQ